MTNLRFVGAVAAAVIAASATTVPVDAAAQESSWDRIKRLNMVTTGCFTQLPYWSRDVSGNWKGWGIEAAKQLAADLKTNWRCEETSWGTAALNIQAGKIDLLWAMQATPVRATAITFAGPLYNHGFMTVNNKNFNGKNWVDYNKPGVRIAAQAGTSTALVRKFVAPQATALELPQESDLPLAVIAGRADAMITTVINGIVAKSRNPDIGSFVIPQPLFSFPAYAGVAVETDPRFRDFMHWWTEWYRLRGDVEQWIKDGLKEMGVKDDDIPDKLYF